MTERKIWLIDDDRLQNLINKKAIERCCGNAVVKSFTNAKEAFSALQSNSPDIIFLDLNMPEVSGAQFLQMLDEANFHVNIVILSSSIDPNDKNLEEQYSNVMRFISKPLTKDKLQDLMAVFA